MQCDLLYVSHNRREFTEATFAALTENTNWDRVHWLFVYDDASTDGTWEYLDAAAAGRERDVTLIHDRFGGPVSAMNHYLDRNTGAGTVVKLDNDVLVCPGWLDTLLDALDRAPEIDALGFEAGFGGGIAPADQEHRASDEVSHIGGVGAFRTRVFRDARPRGHDRFHGLTEFWRDHARCAWLQPDLPCVLLDHLPFEPWLSLAESYVARGWSRPWPKYPDSMREYWAWAFEEAVA